MKIGCSEVPKQTFPPYFYQLSERHQPLRLTDGCIYGIGSYCDIGLSDIWVHFYQKLILSRICSLGHLWHI